MTSPIEEVDCLTGSRRTKGASRHRSEGIYLFRIWKNFLRRVLVVWPVGNDEDCYVTSTKRLDAWWGDSSASSPSLFGGQWRQVSISSCWRAAACHPGGSALGWRWQRRRWTWGLAKLLKGRTGHAPCVSSNAGSYKYSLRSLCNSVVEALPLIDMLLVEATIFLEEFQSLMLLPPEVAAVIQEIRGNLVATMIRDCRAARDRMFVLSERWRLGWPPSPFDPLACSASSSWRKRRPSLAHCWLPESERSVRSSATSGIVVRWRTLAYWSCLWGVTWPASRVCCHVADCFHRMRLFNFLCWPEVSNKYLKMTEVEGTKVSSKQTLSLMCCSLPMGFSWSLYFAESANRTR